MNINMNMNTNSNTSINDINKPLVITYCNKYKSENYENTHRLIKTLKNNEWDYHILGDGEEWKGFNTKIHSVKNFLSTLNPEKIVIISDAHDVYCIKNSFHFISLFKLCNKSIITSMEYYAEGDTYSNPNINSYNVTWLGPYFDFYNLDYKNILKPFVNGGLIAGYAKDLFDLYNWTITNNYTDDQKAIGAYMNTFPDKVFADFESEILHTCNSLINGGIDSYKQVIDSPNINELIGQKSFFLHIPGIVQSKGQKYLYECIYQILQFINCNEIHNIYPRYNLKYYNLKN